MERIAYIREQRHQNRKKYLRGYIFDYENAKDKFTRTLYRIINLQIDIMNAEYYETNPNRKYLPEMKAELETYNNSQIKVQ